MNSYVILCISMLCALGANIIKKIFTGRFNSKKETRFLFNAVISFSCMLSLLIISGIPKISGFTLLLGVMFGTVTATQFVFSLLSYECGPFSYTSVIVSLSTIIPALSGYFIWGEKIFTVQIFGIGLMLLCFAFSVDFKKTDKKAPKKWFLYVFITFITTGIIGVMQKWHQSSEYKDELDGFLIIAFLTAFLISAIGFFITAYPSLKSKGERSNLLKFLTPIAVVLMVACGVCAAANNKMNLYLSGVMDSAIFFPVVNGGGMILSTVASVIIFKEKLGIQKCLGIAIGVVAVVLICNPF